MELDLPLEDLKLYLGICISLVTIIGIGLGIQRYYYRNKLEAKEDRHKAEVSKLEAQHEKECAELAKKTIDDNNRLRKALESEFSEKEQQQLLTDDAPLVQEVKMVYVKYIHIRKESEPPVYQKKINRLEREIDVHSEYHYYRFNKYNRPNNEITIKDASSGVVDLNILHPWKDLEFTDRPSKINEKSISQRLDSSDVYFSSTTYYNGFKVDNEDIGMRMEMDTLTARMIADFSSIVGVDKLFTKAPDAYRRSKNGDKTKLASLQELNTGVYYLEVNNLKKGESLMLDFHVDWDWLAG